MAEANATPKADDFDNCQFNCLLCLNKLITPRFLPCYHTFCESCLGDHITTNVKNMSETIICPVCKKLCCSPDSKIPFDKWASSFPMNRMMLSVRESKDAIHASHFCDLCIIEGDNIDAEYWCSECTDKLCNSCQRHHKRSRTSRHHVTVRIQEMGDMKFSKFHFNHNCNCGKNNTVETYCIDHQQAFCILCSSTVHRPCKEVRSLDHVVKEFTERNVDANILNGLKKMLKYVQKFQDIKQHNDNETESDIESCVHDVEKLCCHLKEEIDNFLHHFQNTAYEIRSNMKSKSKENDKNIQSFRTNVNNTSQIFKILQQHGNSKQKFLTYRANVPQLKAHYVQLKCDLQNIEDTAAKLELNKDIQNVTDIVSNLGELIITTSQSTNRQNFITDMDKSMQILEAKSQEKHEMCAAQIPIEVSSKPAFVKSVSRQDRGMSGTLVTGGTTLSNGNVILGDINNGRLLEFDSKYDFIMEHYIDDVPIDIDKLGDDIYMSVWSGRGITNLTKCRIDTGKITVVSKFKAEDGTWGLAACGDHLITGTCKAVQILSLTGSTETTINKSGGTSYVAVPVKHSDVFYFTDGDEVVCRSFAAEKFRYRHEKLKSPCGLCVDNRDILYVCGHKSNNVHQITPEGQSVGIIELQNIREPMAAVYNHYNNDIIITSDGEQTALEIYRVN